MTLNAALLLHIKIRNSTTRRLFTFIESKLEQEHGLANRYFETIIFKYHVSECSNIIINGLFLVLGNYDTLPSFNYSQSLQMADLFSDLLYVNSKKDDLKKFAIDISTSQEWTKEACYVIGNLFSILKQHEKALVWLHRALIIDPNYECALIASGNEYIELKSPIDAIMAYSTAISNFCHKRLLIKLFCRIKSFELS